MKLTSILLLVAAIQVSARGTAQKVTYSAESAQLTTVFAEIKKQTGFVFFFFDADLKNTTPVTVNLQSVDLSTALETILSGQPLRFKIEGNTILISAKTGEAMPHANFLDKWPPVKGVVKDLNGEPIAGVNIIVKGTKKGTTSTADGKFSIEANEGEVLIISSINYGTKEIKISDRNASLIVALEKSVSQLDEVQYIAYGTTSRKLSTGNISSVKAKDIEKSPVTNVLLAIQGRVPGVFIQQATGVMGSAVSVRIQGQNSIVNGNEPFYVVDGVPYPQQMLSSLNGIQLGGSPLNFLNPKDIESIDVLKDADATSIYGSRAANGAILITTKKGKAGQTVVDLNFESGFGQVPKKLDMLNTQQYLEMRKEAYVNDGLLVPNHSTTPDPSNFDLTLWDQNRYTDWQKVLIGGKAQYMDAQASASGGNTNTQLLLRANYHKETDVFPGDFANNRGSVYFNANTVSNNHKFRMRFSGNYLIDRSGFPGMDLTSEIFLSPNAPALLDENGMVNWQASPDGISTWTNPLAFTLLKYNNKTNNLTASSEIGYELFPGLVVKSSFGYNKLESDERTFTPQIYYSPELRKNRNLRKASYLNKQSSSWIVEPQITYQLNRRFGNLDFLVGSTFQQSNSDLMAMAGSGYSSDAQLENIRAAATLRASNAVQTVYNYNAVFGRINYNYDNKYLVNLSFRRDGSSRFGSNNLFHNFYSIGTAWVFSEESWLKNKLSFLSFGKLKLSYGTSGNDQIGDYSFMSLYNPYSVDIPYGGVTGLVPSGHSNPYLQWEETYKGNIGLDLGFANSKVTLNLNYYRNRSSNQLMGYPLPFITGFPYINQNFNAKVQNSGFEMAINSTNIKSKNFQWTTNLNLTVNRNKLVEFPGLTESSYANSFVIGKPVNILKVFKYAGVNSQTGTYQFEAADKSMTGSPLYTTDQTVLIDISPRYYGGFQNNFTYKDFSLDILFQFVKQIGIDPLKFGVSWPGIFNTSALDNQPSALLNRWKTPGDVTDIQKVTNQFPMEYFTAGSSDASYVDASYIKLKNLSLSWYFPAGWRDKLHLQNARIYIQGQNLLTITKYPGLDPETKSSGSLPPLRVLTFGIQVTL